MKTINAFPGYEFVYDDKDKQFHNMYRGTDVGKGGYVYSEPGIYGNVALLDIAGMHPASLIAMNCFGKYTKNFKDIRDARIAIKHGNFDAARKMLDGKLAPYLNDESVAKDLSQALKISVNSVYGLTSANFDTPMRDIRNKNNIVALRGALFMRTLQDEIQNKGFIVSHIKTDSMKVPDATPEVIQFMMEFAKKYAYEFEHEATYERMCLINNSTYIAKYATAEQCEKLYGYIPDKNKKHGGKWTATAAQFQVPYVFKKLFSKEPIEFDDLCETKEVKTALYLDMNENLSDGEHAYRFVGKVGLFCPIKPGCGGGELLRIDKNVDENGNPKFFYATGAKGYRWLESEMVKELGKEGDIDLSYYDKLVDAAVESISKYGDFEWFVSDDPYVGPDYDANGRPVYYPEDDVPWRTD